MVARRRFVAGGKSGLQRAAEWVIPTPHTQLAGCGADQSHRDEHPASSVKLGGAGDVKRGNLSAEQDQIDPAKSGPLDRPEPAGAGWVGRISARAMGGSAEAVWRRAAAARPRPRGMTILPERDHKSGDAKEDRIRLTGLLSQLRCHLAPALSGLSRAPLELASEGSPPGEV